MAIKAGDPGKRPGNIPADVRGVQVRPEWIARHEKENYTLSRLSPAFFRALVFSPGSSPGDTISASVYLPF